MILMVTNRLRSDMGYGDEEQDDFEFEYLFDHLNGPPGQDGFASAGKEGFEKTLESALSDLKHQGINTPKVGVYLHGYNNDWQDSIDELVDLEKALKEPIGYRPVLIGFSWPSSGKTKNYLSDREEVRDSNGSFVRFLLSINDYLLRNERRCFATTFCIAHSMGNYLLRKGMEYMSDFLGAPQGRMMFNETVMLAPDLASKDIERDGKGKYIADFSRRVHVYYSRNDRALKASSTKRFGANRLGRHGADSYSNLPENIVVINAEKYANSTSSKGLKDRREEQVSVHSSHRYHPKILADVGEVLSSVDRPLISKRRVIPASDGSEHPERPNHFALL